MTDSSHEFIIVDLTRHEQLDAQADERQTYRFIGALRLPASYGRVRDLQEVSYRLLCHPKFGADAGEFRS